MEEVREWLVSHDLGKYVDTIISNEVDSMEVFVLYMFDLEQLLLCTASLCSFGCVVNVRLFRLFRRILGFVCHHRD